MKKSQVDLKNAVVRILDSKTPNGIADVRLTPLALGRSATSRLSPAKANSSSQAT
ncbi:MAG TPA: hypothetical protein VEI49_06230 [Terriglobales bacterium]|nr:hypothetical protein [Terriglobales bacterium]